MTTIFEKYYEYRLSFYIFIMTECVRKEMLRF
ncbi:hypothetical protein OKW21_005713 [Catalinimonas alkaloidigena]|nr:hypothetical protein [Catalinimonas alkaloidigena]